MFEHFSIPAFDANQAPSLDRGEEIKSAKYEVTPDAVLLSKLNPRIPRAWLPNDPAQSKRQIASTEFLVAVPLDGWSRWYLYCQFTEDAFREEMRRRATGTSTSHQRVRPRDFESILVVEPPEEVRGQFVRAVDPMFRGIASRREESATLTAIRDTLLPKLISGEVSASGVEVVKDGR